MMIAQKAHVPTQAGRGTATASMRDEEGPGTGRHAGAVTEEPPMPWIRFDKVDAWYGQNQVLRQVTFDVSRHSITAFIGPSGPTDPNLFLP